MPSPTSRKPVFLHAFAGFRGPQEPLVARCKGGAPPPPTLEECILYAGHTGVSFSDPFGPIYGFLPVAEGLDPLTLVSRLKSLDPTESVFPGEVSDHKPIFEMAAEYAASQNQPPAVITVEYSYPAETAEVILAAIEQQLAGVNLTYSFPMRGGDCNCVTWLAKLGLEIPPHNPAGQMAKYLPGLRELLDHEPILIGEASS